MEPNVPLAACIAMDVTEPGVEVEVDRLSSPDLLGAEAQADAMARQIAVALTSAAAQVRNAVILPESSSHQMPSWTLDKVVSRNGNKAATRRRDAGRIC